MKKIICGVLSIILLALSLSSCSLVCEHEWTEATCTTPKTCTLCGKTEGDALGHNWTEATCESPKACMRCGETEGEALGHSMIDNVCERCGYKEWSVEDFGFYDFYKCNKFLEIDSYDLIDKVVKFKSHYTYWTYEFFDNYIERIGYNEHFGNDIDKLMYNIIDFENLNWTEGTLRIIDRVSVDEQNNYLILKCITGDASERWFISYDAIDWTKSPQAQEIDNEHFLKFYLK